MGLKRPEIMRGVTPNSEVRFTYTTKDGDDVYVSGHIDSVSTKGSDGDRVTGIRVRLSVSAKLPGKGPGDIALLALDRIHPDPETGLIIPVSKKELATGTGSARFIRPRAEHVAYAVRLSGTVPAGTETHTEEEFRAMSRHDLNEWIDMAKYEIQNAKDEAAAAEFRGEDA